MERALAETHIYRPSIPRTHVCLTASGEKLHGQAPPFLCEQLCAGRPDALARFAVTMYLLRDDHLIFHGCIPVDDAGEFLPDSRRPAATVGAAMFDSIESFWSARLTRSFILRPRPAPGTSGAVRSRLFSARTGSPPSNGISSPTSTRTTKPRIRTSPHPENFLRRCSGLAWTETRPDRPAAMYRKN